MKVSELISLLEEQKALHGDKDVNIFNHYEGSQLYSNYEVRYEDFKDFEDMGEEVSESDKYIQIYL